MFMIAIAISLIIFFAVLNLLFLRYLNATWWKSTFWRLVLLALPLTGAAGVLFWALGPASYASVTRAAGRLITSMAVVVEASLAAALFLSGIVQSLPKLLRLMRRAPRSNETPTSPERRDFIKYAAGVFPAAALGSDFGGIAGSYAPIQVPVREVPVNNLPGPLHGLKIAQLSDLHLGYYVKLDDLAAAVEEMGPHDPDLVLVTGDIADDLRQLPEALRIIERLNPQYGTWACVGNHEYYRGIGQVLRIFADAPFPLLIEESVELNIRGTAVSIGGADDPVRLGHNISGFLKATIDGVYPAAPGSDFRMLMCHRPEGLDHATEIGISLVFSGHTHGGQIGFMGRSLFDPAFPEKYLWGLYRKGRTTLHTTSGMGHWFPFRLGCPAEAPLLVLSSD